MENMSDSLMPRPLLLCLKSEKIVCYSVPDNNIRVCPECLKEDECKILHVEHQIPEVTVCAKHGCKLMEFTKQKGYEYEFKE